MAPHIHILNGSSLQGSALWSIVAIVEEVFGAPVSLRQVAFDLDLAYDSSRNQTNSTALLAQILNESNGSPGKRIAVVDVDLFIPILTFVFGEAQLSGSAAIVSTHRLANQFYGLTRNDDLMIQRLQKEIVHELGHTFGLYHCHHHFECVMRASTYVEEIDLKGIRPCSSCADALIGVQLSSGKFPT